MGNAREGSARTYTQAATGLLPDLASLVTRPKTAGETGGDLTRPLTFVGVSVAIGFLLQLPQLGKEDVFTTLVASMAVFKVLALVMFAAIIQLVCRMVRGHASFSATFSAYLYIVNPLYIAGVILEIARLGILRAYAWSLENISETKCRSCCLNASLRLGLRFARTANSQLQ
jgi:hypothetical protein